jgi:poly(hydroxyalkanoate) depolymerase family esterase
MAEVTRLARAGKLKEAMALLSGRTARPHSPAAADDTIDMTPPADGKGPWTAPAAESAPPDQERPRRDVGDRFKARLAKGRKAAPRKTRVDVPDGARFEGHMFANAAGQRPYMLYVPSKPAANPALIVMLHGCTQSPEDFAIGTRMNKLAEAHGFLVVYPGQTQGANAQKCWNWFNMGDQQRDRGEPAILAGLTREIVARHDVDAKRVFVAGLSAGGAAAAIMGAAYPDLFSGVGVHSGLACGAARDMPSAFAAMSKGGAAGVKPNGTLVRTIVFHGDIDTTVHAVNGEQVLTQGRARARLEKSVAQGASSGGVRYTRTVESTSDGRPMLEHWVLHGAGHAWSGGSPDGSYTNPAGPDASREMVRFFLEGANLS